MPLMFSASILNSNPGRSIKHNLRPALGLDVDFRTMSAYDLAAINRKFDIVLFTSFQGGIRH